MVSPYYQGDNVPIEFTITYKDSSVTPSYARVDIMKPDRTIVEQDDAAIDTNTVTFTVPSSFNGMLGEYLVQFRLGMSYGERTHQRTYTIQKHLA